LKISQRAKEKKMSTIEKIQEDVLVEEQTAINNEIILYNDDVNTFDHVIDTLIRVCKHTSEQAEQCAILVHYKGQCTVKTGSFDELKPQCSQLLEAGLSAEII
jgi:ATP-dependent Clp protease adaptor protein ClpS